MPNPAIYRLVLFTEMYECFALLSQMTAPALAQYPGLRLRNPAAQLYTTVQENANGQDGKKGRRKNRRKKTTGATKVDLRSGGWGTDICYFAFHSRIRGWVRGRSLSLYLTVARETSFPSDARTEKANILAFNLA